MRAMVAIRTGRSGRELVAPRTRISTGSIIPTKEVCRALDSRKNPVAYVSKKFGSIARLPDLDVSRRGGHYREPSMSISKLYCLHRISAGGEAFVSSVATSRVVMLCAFNLITALAALPVSAAEPSGAAVRANDPVAELVARLSLERYKATIKGLTRFGDRRQGTDRNRAAVDWIESRLRAYGCADVARLRYEYSPEAKRTRSGPQVAPGAAQGGGRFRGQRAPTGVNKDPGRQPDAKLRALDSQPSTPGE